MRFVLPVLPSGTSINDAFPDMIERGRSGLVIAYDVDDFRLVHFDQMKDAQSRGLVLLGHLAGQRLRRLEGHSDTEHRQAIVRLGETIALVYEVGGSAELFSAGEQFADPYMAPSKGVRCQRPNRPPTVVPRLWYHYYPPNPVNPLDPHTCIFTGCGAYVP
jgi:hypothetical protein